MKKVILISILFVSLQSVAQHSEGYEKHYTISQNSIHGKMVLFGDGWTIDEINPFFKYLANDLSIGGNNVDMTTTPTGLKTTISSMSIGAANPPKLNLNFTCNKDGTNITKLVMTGSRYWLRKIFVFYFQGQYTGNTYSKGIIEKKQVYTDIVTLYQNKLVVEKLK